MATTPKCTSVLKALHYCTGTPVVPGIRKRSYAISTSQIARWPKLPVDTNGRPTSAVYTGAFVLVEGAKFVAIDHLANKAEFKSETQGEAPSKTFKVTGSLLHPGVDEAAAAAAAALIGDNVVLLVEDMKGKFRVVGCELYDGASVTVSRDNGQGATGSAGTTIAFEASDIVDAPFYTGPIPTEDGIINPLDTPAVKAEPAG